MPHPNMIIWLMSINKEFNWSKNKKIILKVDFNKNNKNIEKWLLN